VPRRNRTGDGLRLPVDVDAELAAEVYRGGVRVDVTSGADIDRIAFREDPRVTALVCFADVEEEELRIQEGDVFTAEPVLVCTDSFEAPHEARLARDEACGSVRADHDARIDRLAVRLDPPSAVVAGNPGDLGRCAQLGAIVHRAIDEPAIEPRAIDRDTREAGDVEQAYVR